MIRETDEEEKNSVSTLTFEPRYPILFGIRDNVTILP